MSKSLFAVVAMSLFAVTTAHAADCDAMAAEKKLAGAAKNSFLTKCKKDEAVASCDAMAAEKKLAGAAKKSFTTKCVKDAAK